MLVKNKKSDDFTTLNFRLLKDFGQRSILVGRLCNVRTGRRARFGADDGARAERSARVKISIEMFFFLYFLERYLTCRISPLVLLAVSVRSA